VNLMSRNSDKTVLSSLFLGPYKISVANHVAGTYELVNVDGSSALNLGSHRIPTGELILNRSYDSSVPFDRAEFKEILSREDKDGVTYYKTKFHDNTIHMLTSDAFDNSDYLKAFNKKWRKRLHKNQSDKDAMFPEVNSEPLRYYPPTQFMPSFTKHISYTQAVSTQKRPIRNPLNGPVGTKRKQLRFTEQD